MEKVNEVLVRAVLHTVNSIAIVSFVMVVAWNFQYDSIQMVDDWIVCVCKDTFALYELLMLLLLLMLIIRHDLLTN